MTGAIGRAIGERVRVGMHTRVPVRSLFCMLLLLGAPIALAQNTAAKIDIAPFEDSIAQRMQACVICHGEKGGGIASSAFPRLAGQPADYLSAQLRAFREGSRIYAPMNYLMSRQSDVYFAEIAAYFSAQQPDPRVIDAGRAMPFDRNAADAGKLLMSEGRAAAGLPPCKACHGERLSGMLPGTPAIAGLQRDFLIEQLGSWKSGTSRVSSGTPRPGSSEPNCMTRVVSLMSNADIVAAATWLSLQPPEGPPAPPADKLPIACGKS